MKKGISPIIASVILLTIVVVLAGIVYKFSNELLTSFSPPVNCKGVEFEAGIFQEADGKKTLEIRNKGNLNIEFSYLQIINEVTGNINNQEISISINSGDSNKQNLVFEIPIGSKIKIIPQIKNAENKIYSCPEEFSKLINLI